MRADLSSPENFAALVREHQGLVFRTLTRLTGAGPHVEDLAQEAFLRLFRALPDFRGDATLSTYLYRIVVNLSQDEWKRRRRERSHLATEPLALDDDEAAAWLENLPGDAAHTTHARNPEQLLADADLQRTLEAELLRLPENERNVLVLYHQEECSYEGISIALGMPVNTVRTHLHRGRKRLAASLEHRLGSRSAGLTPPIPSAKPAATLPPGPRPPASNLNTRAATPRPSPGVSAAAAGAKA